MGAPFIAWLGMGKALLLSGLMMMLSNLLFMLLAVVGHDPVILGIAVGTENFTSGVGLTVFVTYLSGLSNLAYTATQFALTYLVCSCGQNMASCSGRNVG